MGVSNRWRGRNQDSLCLAFSRDLLAFWIEGCGSIVSEDIASLTPDLETTGKRENAWVTSRHFSKWCSLLTNLGKLMKESLRPGPKSDDRWRCQAVERKAFPLGGRSQNFSSLVRLFFSGYCRADLATELSPGTCVLELVSRFTWSKMLLATR